MQIRGRHDPTPRRHRGAMPALLDRRPHHGGPRRRGDWLAGYRQGRPLLRALAETALTILALLALSAVLTWMQAGGGR
jgi:hypothetical protein